MQSKFTDLIKFKFTKYWISRIDPIALPIRFTRLSLGKLQGIFEAFCSCLKNQNIYLTPRLQDS